MEIPREFYKQHMHELTRYIAAEEYDGIVFIHFARGQKQMTVQFRRKDFVEDDEIPSVWGWLNEIADYPKSINWDIDAGDWCYISRMKKGHLRFTQMERRVNSSLVKEPPWARRIYEDEIEYEEYGPMDYNYGRWRGREVDVYKAWLDKDLPLLNRAMKAYRRLQGMNLTYDLLGHLVKPSDGSLIGLVTEPMIGRPLELHDSRLVFSALRRLNKIGYILDAPQGSMLINSAGELRITAMHNVIPLPEDPQERERRINMREDSCLRWVFGEMERTFGAGPRWRVPAHTRGQIIVPVQVLVPLNNPEKILSLDYNFNGGGQVSSEKRWAVEKFRDIWSSVHPDHAVEMWKLARICGIKRMLEVDSEESECDTMISRRRRSTKKLRKKPKRCRSETPLPQLPVAIEDLPLMPPSVIDFQGRDRSTSVTLVGSGSMSPTAWEYSLEEQPVSPVPSWMLEGEGEWYRLALENEERIEVID